MSRRGRNKSKFSLFAFQDIITAVTGIMVLVTLILALELIQRTESSAQAQTKQIIEQATEVTGDIDDLRNDIAQTEQDINRVRQILARKAKNSVELATHDIEKIRKRIGDLRRIQTELKLELQELARQQGKIRASNDKVKDKKIDPKEIDKLKKNLVAMEKRLKELKNSKARIYTLNPGESRVPWLVQLSAGKILVARVGKSERPLEFSNADRFAAWLGKQKPSASYFMLLLKPDGVSLFQQVRTLLKQQRFDTGYDLLSQDELAINPQRGADL